MLSKKAIQTQIANYEEMMGDDYRDITKILENAMTIGELKEILNDMDDSLPVRLDVLRVERNGDLSAEEGFLLATREVITEESDEEESESLILVACSNFSPEALEKYPDEFE